MEIQSLQQELTEIRRYLHKNPELGFQEYNTSEYIRQYLNALNFDKIETLANTGIKAVMYATNPKYTLGFRCDMDALDGVDEKNNISYSSTKTGIMHACGHDGHAAMLMGFAKYISLNKARLINNVVLIFQPAEELMVGAKPMIEQGVLEDPKVDCIFGIHLLPDIEQGKIGLRAGTFMAHHTAFNIEVQGKPSHGASPHMGIDSIVIAAQVVNMLQPIMTRCKPPYEQALISIGKITGGNRRNIIAEKTIMEGILRTPNDETCSLIRAKIEDMLEGLGRVWNTQIRFEEVVDSPAVYNGPLLTNQLIDLFKQDNIVDVRNLMFAEDFACYQKKVPGVFMFLGTGNSEKGFTYPLHSDRFNFDEEVLLVGVNAFRKIVDSSLTL